MSQQTIIVPGTPIAQARPRFFRRGKYVGTYNPQETEAGKFLLLAKSQIREKIPPKTPITMDCRFYMPIPQSWSKKKQAAAGGHTSPPDVSNLVKFIEDVLNGIAWDDDRQIGMIMAVKLYSKEPRTEIVLSW